MDGKKLALAAVDATAGGKDGTVIWASRAEGRLERAGRSAADGAGGVTTGGDFAGACAGNLAGTDAFAGAFADVVALPLATGLAGDLGVAVGLATGFFAAALAAGLTTGAGFLAMPPGLATGFFAATAFLAGALATLATEDALALPAGAVFLATCGLALAGTALAFAGGLADTFLDVTATLAGAFAGALVAFLAGVFTSCLLTSPN